MRKIDKTFEFSHTLVNNYGNWLNSEKDYDFYYGRSENPPSYDDYELGCKLQFYTNLFKIKVKPEFEKEDTSLVLGSLFEDALNNLESKNELEFISNKNEKYTVKLNPDFETLIENRRKAQPRKQVKISGVLPNGLNFIGYADEIYENCIIDVKTTSNFSKLNYDKSKQIPLYLHFIPDYLVQRGFYQVTEFYKSKAVGKNEFTMKDTFMIECSKITEKQLTEFADLCLDVLNNIPVFEKDIDNYRKYFE